MTGTIFDQKEFAVFDGPGIRQTIFLKGCPLRCSWCHNPEGLSAKPQMMVSQAACIDCGKCRQVCESTSDGQHTCTQCGRCISVCPQHVRRIAGEVVTAEELVHRIRKDSAYYQRYGGGVTFSGGEPLMQAQFLLEVLEQIPDLHTAVETSGCCDLDTFAQVVEQLDYTMIDMKLFDSEQHRKYTGVDNHNILENVRWLCQGNKPFVVRIPVIPGVNDSQENYRQTAEWIKNAPNLVKVELLPYHMTAGAKYPMIGQTYQPAFDDRKKIFISQQIFEDYGIRSEIL